MNKSDFYRTMKNRAWPVTALFLIQVFCSAEVIAQDGNADKLQIKVAGLVKTDFFFDTRQTVCAREGHFLLFPAAHNFDPDGKDLNAKSGFNFIPVQSNLSVSATGPDILGAKILALIEGDFFGISNNDVNMLRLRHAYLKMTWPKAELITGQYWHPLFVSSCYPGTVSFNTGAPIQPFSRAPQVRVSYIPGILKLSAALLSQRDYASNGPDGVSSKYLRDSNFPEIQIMSEIAIKNKNETVFGTGFGYKQLTPQIKTGKGFQTSQKVYGISVNAYFKQVIKYVTFKLEGIYLENGSEFLTLGGYAVRDSINPAKGLVNYVPIKTIACWSEIHTNGKKIQIGLFAGYTENLGAGTETKGPLYLMSNMPVKSLYRISPRIYLKPGLLAFALEVEFTSALYGSPDMHGDIINTSRVSNTRILLSTQYKF